jgi:Cu2+-exporting ATPase
MTAAVLHETAHRLRLALPPQADAGAVQEALTGLAGVRAVRVNRRLRCVAVEHDGRRRTRNAVLRRLGGAATPDAAGAAGAADPAGLPLAEPSTRARAAPARTSALGWAPAALAAAVPVLPAAWRSGAALAAIGTRLVVQPERLRRDAPAALLDAASLAALAVNRQPLVVSASLLLRWLAERLSGRLVAQADALLDHLLPEAASHYLVLAEPGARATRWPLRALRAGDRLRLLPGDVVPVDGCVVDGEATLVPALVRHGAHRVVPGDHLAAGERLRRGTLVLQAEADVRGSRLERLRAQVQHAIGARDPAGPLAPGLDRLLSLPLTAAALVLGLTGDSARAAAMLQADPQQGIDLALPLAREGALLALAHRGLLTAGLEAVERLASARVAVLQDSGVLASGRWTVASVEVEPGGDAARVRHWLAALAGLPPDAPPQASVPDRVLREWMRHGAVLRVGTHELHLATRRRLRRVWHLEPQRPAAPAAGAGPDGLRREFAVVAAGRVVAWVVLASAWREGLAERLRALQAMGFDRLAVCGDDTGAEPMPALPQDWPLERLPEDAPGRGDWLAAAGRDGRPLLLVHTVLRDLLPPGSLSLTTPEADAGAHGVLLGDPLAALVAARRLAQRVHRRLRRQHTASASLNSMLMAASALRWIPPMGSALVHHGFALLLLLDSLRLEPVTAGAEPPDGDGETAQ